MIPFLFVNSIWNKSESSKLSPLALKQTLCFPESFAVNIILIHNIENFNLIEKLWQELFNF